MTNFIINEYIYYTLNWKISLLLYPLFPLWFKKYFINKFYVIVILKQYPIIANILTRINYPPNNGRINKNEIKYLMSWMCYYKND
jgi:hypothetical protein